MRRLAFNSMVLAIGSYFASGISALTYLLAARALGPNAFGSLSSAIGLAIVVAAFGDFGVNGWAIRALARSPSATDLFSNTLTAKLSLAALLALAWIIISIAIPTPTSLKAPIALIAGYMFSQIVAGTLTVPFRASENMTIVSIVGVVEKAVTLTVWLAMQSLVAYRLEALPIALVAGGLASVVCAGFFIPREFLAIARPSLRQVCDLWRLSYSFGMVGVSAQIQRVDVAIVNGIAGPYAAGVYAAPARLTTFLAVIPASFSSAVFPRLARSSRAGTSRRPELVSAAVLLALMALLLGAAAMAAPFLVPALLGHAYLSSVGVLQIYLLAVLINSVNQPLLALLQADGQEHYVGRAMVASATGGIVAVAAGAFVGGAAGGAAGAVLLQMLQLVLFGSKALQGSHRMTSTYVTADGSETGVQFQLLPTNRDDQLS